ncbi:helix-turn-helix transcriptional regulator [Actinoallomurus sp. CA-142502]|uniref:helix-turn-helix transcriptional regulator n=1 Tax=Actinoallomurus sp. CA-142502 TaxID=3239885 RepID=UPI003D9189C4
MSHGLTAASTHAFDSQAGADLERPSRRGWRGRSREWRAVTAAIEAAQRSRGAVLLVEGQAGMGKSRLLSDAVEAAAARGFMLAHGAADEPSRLAPLVPLMAALGESPQTLREGLDTTAETADLRLRLLERLQSRLEERAAHGPFLIALDDLQWADPTTLLALRSIVPELASYPLVWILARTTGIAESDADRVFEILAREGAARIVLEPLGDRAVGEVIGDVLGAAPGPELLAMTAATGGNPFLLVELLHGLQDENAVRVADGEVTLVSRQLPRRMQEIARSRLGRLCPHTRHLLQVAAVLGRSFRVDDLAEMFDEPPSRLLPALEEAESAAVVAAAGDQLTFRHELLWQAVTETVTVPVRHALHRQAAEMLLRRGGSAIPAAAHLMHYARPGDGHALKGLDQAVREVLPSSPQSAADLAVRALELTMPGDPDRVDRTVTAVYALTTCGRLPEATDFARTAIGQARHPEQAARLRSELAYALLLAGRPADAAAEAEQALAQPDLIGDKRGLAEQVFLRALYATHDFRRGRELAEEIIDSGRRHDRAAQVGARMLFSYIAWGDGQAAEGISHVREAVRIAPRDDASAGRVHPRLHLATLLTDMRRLEEADAQLNQIAAEIAEFGQSAYAATPAIFRARLRLAEGRLDDAAAEAQAGLAVAEQMGTNAFMLLGLAVLVAVAVRRGELDAAAGHAQRYEERYRAGTRLGKAWARWPLATLAEAREGPARAFEILRPVCADLNERRWLLMSEPDAAAWLARTALAAGDRSSAEAVAVTAEQLARANTGFSALAAAAAHARGVLRGDRVTLAHAAATHPSPWSRASAAEDLGVLLAGSRGRVDDDAAIEALDRALEGYQRIGALRDAARIRARLRRLGVRRRHWTQAERPLSGWSSLTETERNVAVLAAQGLTNPQVATQMFVSPHTVKFHLRQVFRKLGIASRVELARLAAEHASEPPSSEA